MIMKRRFAAVILAFWAVLLLCGFSSTFTQGTTNYVYDEANILSEADEAKLNEYIASVRDKAKSDFLVVTTQNPATDDLIDAAEAITHAWVQAGNGYGEDHQVILFYVDMANRGYYLQEYNAREKWRLSNSEIDEITYSIEGYLRNGDYGTAAGKAIEAAAECAKPGFFQRIWGWLTAGLAGGGIASGIAVGTHNTRSTTPVRHYMAGQRLATTRNEDHFTHTTTVVQPKVTVENQGGSMGGGGGGHISAGSGHSSGSHGGGGHF